MGCGNQFAIFFKFKHYNINMKGKILTENKAAKHSYSIESHFEAGIKLTGPEVKSAKNGNTNLVGSYVTMRVNSKGNPEAWLIGASIGPYAKAGYAQTADYKRDRARKLLLNKKELRQLVGKQQEKGLTIIPLSLYTTNGLIKIDVAIAKGASASDKREKIKKRDFDRSRQRLLSR